MKAGDGEPRRWRKYLYYHFYDDGGEHNVSKHDGVSDKRYKLIHFYEDGVWELYDLAADKNELDNIYGKPGTEEITAQLKEKLVALQKQYGEEQFIAE